jgi:hypothetical protein
MGIPNAQEYRSTDHYLERLNERITPCETHAEALKYFRQEQAKFTHSGNSANHTELYSNGVITFVLNVKELKIITVYKEDTHFREFKEEVNAVVDKYIKIQEDELRQELANIMTDIFTGDPYQIASKITSTADKSRTAVERYKKAKV